MSLNSHPYQNMHERFEPMGKDSPGNGPQMSLNVVIDIFCCKNLVFNNLFVTTRLPAGKISFHLYISFSLPQNLNFLMEHFHKIFIPGLIKKNSPCSFIQTLNWYRIQKSIRRDIKNFHKSALTQWKRSLTPSWRSVSGVSLQVDSCKRSLTTSWRSVSEVSLQVDAV